ncbi:MAG: glycosyltransferase family 39 protein [Bryobacteraceae bacterium]
MPEITQMGTRRVFDRVLWAIVIAAVIVRIAAAFYQGNLVEPLPGVWDQISYHNLAVRVLEGHGFSFATGWWPVTPTGQPTAHWSYLYVLYLVLVYSVFGANPLAARLIQALITGVLQILLTYRVGKRVFSRRAGLIAAALATANAYFILYSGALMTESLYIVALLWAVDISTAMTDRDAQEYSPARASTWVWLGLALGIAVLLRQVTLLLVPVVLGWVVWRILKRLTTEREERRRHVLTTVRQSVISMIILAGCILPWTIRNYKAFGTFVLLNTNAGFAFFWANHPIHGTDFIPILPADKASYGDLIPPELGGLDEARLDRALLQRGLAFVWDDPTRYARLSLSLVREYFKFWPSANSGTLSNYARVLSFGVCCPFLVAGLALCVIRPGRVDGFREDGKAHRLFLILIAALYTLLHLLSWALIRYRLPIDAITLPFAAVAMGLMYDRLAGLRGPIGVSGHSTPLQTPDH